MHGKFGAKPNGRSISEENMLVIILRFTVQALTLDPFTPTLFKVMKELGYDLSGQHPKDLVAVSWKDTFRNSHNSVCKSRRGVPHHTRSIHKNVLALRRPSSISRNRRRKISQIPRNSRQNQRKNKRMVERKRHHRKLKISEMFLISNLEKK